ncbi:hypothetical protein CCH79_00014444 [Gambusia affinis]|uniref:Uncharacterized protein n=1 Tax=Gambusia affinis TaxID=33528 RepID=A0A315UWW6_GAMAF|nr:hypothetical protein CCH79_00014444 [Gambusia affinis]
MFQQLPSMHPVYTRSITAGCRASLPLEAVHFPLSLLSQMLPHVRILQSHHCRPQIQAERSHIGLLLRSSEECFLTPPQEQ